jgi:peptide/nickel transport system permease protein
MTTTQPSPARLTWDRRRSSAVKTWRQFRQHTSGMVGLAILACFALIAIFAPVLADADGLEFTTAPGTPLEPPSSEFWLGTDQHGRSVLTLLIWGSRVSLLIGLMATVISMVLGTVIGLASGHFRGWTGTLLFRFTEWVLVVPFLPLAVVMASLLGPSLLNSILVIGVLSWPSTALLIRAQTLSIESRPYMERAKVLGGGHWRQMTRHVLPNVMPLVMANTALTVAIAILAETTLAFLGLGGDDRISWGGILDQSFGTGPVTNELWWYFLPPGFCVMLVVLAFILIGRALEDVFNPQLRER